MERHEDEVVGDVEADRRADANFGGDEESEPEGKHGGGEINE